MKLSELITRCKLEIPNINQTGISDTQFATLLNQACDKANLIAKFYTDYTDFDIVAEKQFYSLSENVPLYLGRDKRGLYFKNSDDEWDEIYPKTEAWMRRVYPNYLNSSSAALPRWYWIEGDTLGFHQKPSTSYTNGARLYHLKKANSMSSGDDYPYSGNETEITAFSPIDDALISYVRWKTSPAFGSVTDQDLRMRDFYNECRSAAKQIKRKPDIMHDHDARIHV